MPTSSVAPTVSTETTKLAIESPQRERSSHTGPCPCPFTTSPRLPSWVLLPSAICRKDNLKAVISHHIVPSQPILCPDFASRSLNPLLGALRTGRRWQISAGANRSDSLVLFGFLPSDKQKPTQTLPLQLTSQMPSLINCHSTTDHSHPDPHPHPHPNNQTSFPSRRSSSYRGRSLHPNSAPPDMADSNRNSFLGSIRNSVKGKISRSNSSASSKSASGGYNPQSPTLGGNPFASSSASSSTPAARRCIQPPQEPWNNIQI